MTAYLALLSMGVLLLLLVYGRWPAAVLFTVWAAAYYLFGLIDESALLTSYSNPALATLILLLLVSLALERSVLLERLTQRLLSGRETLACIKLMGVAAGFSAFLNNTVVVSALLSSMARQTLIPASRLLMSLSYASILGGVTTLVGTSTNLVVNSFVVSNGLAPIGMFQLAWVGVPVALACIGVIAFSARWLPRHRVDTTENAQPYFLEARLSPGSALAGRSIEANGLRQLNGLFLLEIERKGRLISPVGPDQVLQADDVLLFTGEVNKFQALQDIAGLDVFGTRSDTLLNANLVEVIVSSGSELAQQTLRELDFRTMFDAGVVAIRRGERRLTGQLGRIPLKAGDSLLLAVGPDFAQHRNLDRNFHVLGGPPIRPQLNTSQSAFVWGGFGVVIAGSASGVLDLLPGLMLLLSLLLVTRVLTLAELRRRFPFDLLMVIGSALALAKGLEGAGAAQLVADGMRTIFEGYGVFGALMGVYLLTVMLTELVTNNAAAALAFPVALATARAFGVDPTAFVMVVAYGASACFLIPFGYQTHLMVMSPGRYKMVDFLRTGLPVSVVYSVGVLWLTPLFFPLKPV
jgi:di/tricarboxylate transporter